MSGFLIKNYDPISEARPCGVDSDNDLEIQNFIAAAEGQLPLTYRDFNRKDFDAKTQIAAIEGFLQRSRDVRLLVLAAKSYILSDNIIGFADVLATIGDLLDAQWDDAYPQAANGNFDLRSAHLKSLDDMPTVILPLQNATLLKDRRLGQLTYRTQLVASKALPPRKDEEVPDPNLVRDAFLRTEPVSVVTDIHATVERINHALKQIREKFVAQAGFESAPSFSQLPELAGNIAGFLLGILQQRAPEHYSQPTGGTGAGEVPGGLPATADVASLPSDTDSIVITSAHNVASALEAIVGYYGIYEPSSPARLLVRQAQQLVGKTFVEAMQVLAPGMVDDYKIRVGGDTPFALSFAQLVTLAADASQGDGPAAEPQTFKVFSRDEAARLMRAVELFYRRNEPSSPIPLLIEKARQFVDKDFHTLLKEVAGPRE